MGDESRWDDQHRQDWGDRYRRQDRPGREERFDREERRYGAGDFEGSRYGRYDQPTYGSGAGWPTYEPGRNSPEFRDRSGEEHAWERAASEQGYGPPRRDERRAYPDFGGWDAPFGGHPLHRDEQRGQRDDTWDRLRHEGRSFLDRTRDELSSFFGGRREDEQRADQERYRSEGAFRGRGPRGYHRSDERIRDEIHERLTDDSWLDASDIEVTVHEGEVTLDGRVRSRTDKRRAEDIVERVSGVGHVQNNLRADSDPGRREDLDIPPLI
jgi:hypothetical protein